MQRVSGFAEQGAKIVWTQSYASANVFQETYPFAKIAVYVTGTTTLATLFSDNNTPPTPLANPFTADENGWWWFYAPNGRYDIQIWPRTSPPDVPWTIGDVLVADYGTSIQTGGIDLDNGVCSAHIGFDASCSIVFTGRLKAPSLELNNGACSTTISFGAGCEILVTGQSGNILASLDQNGDFTTAGCIYTPCLFVSGNASIGGNLAVAGQISATGSACLHVPCLYVAGDATVGGSVQAGSVEASVSIWSNGLLGSQTGIETRGNLQVDGSINAGGDISATGNMSAGGNLTVVGQISATGTACLSVPCLTVSGNATVGGSISAGSVTTSGNINTNGLLLIHGASFGPPGGPGGPVWQTWTPTVWDFNGVQATLSFGIGYYMIWGAFAIIQISIRSTTHLGGMTVGSPLWYVSVPFTAADNGSNWGQGMSVENFSAHTQDAVLYQNAPGIGPAIGVNALDIPAGSDTRIFGVVRI